MSDADAVPDALAGAPASARHIYSVLDAADERLTYEELRNRTGYSEHTVSKACQLLDRRGVADRRRAPDEPRRYEVHVHVDEPD